MRSPGRAAAALVVAVAALVLAAQAGAAQPNIVLILTDDQRWDTLEHMPTVQSELVGRGITFENGFVTNPRCCPSRASILTGAYTHTTRVYQNSGALGGFNAFRDESTVATWLDGVGYETALIGKYLNVYPGSYVPPGWDRWAAFIAQGGFYTYGFDLDGQTFPVTAQETYSTDFLAEEAVSFIRTAAGPFFLYFAPYAPHAPATPATRHEDAFAALPPGARRATTRRTSRTSPRGCVLYRGSMPPVRRGWTPSGQSSSARSSPSTKRSRRSWTPSPSGASSRTRSSSSLRTTATSGASTGCRRNAHPTRSPSACRSSSATTRSSTRRELTRDPS